jgi:hypothetical protein
MLKDTNYDLMEEITQLSKSLARYDLYVKDATAAGCDDCVALWQEIKTRHERDLGDLMKHFKAHIDAGVVDFGST